MARVVKNFLILVLLLAVIPTLFFYYQLVKSQSELGKDKIFNIEKGETVKIIGNNLIKADLMNNYFVFEAYVWLSDKKAKFMAGSYGLNSNYSIKQIVDILTSGQAQSKEKNITIIEGWNIKDIEKHLASADLPKDKDFSKLAKTQINNWSFDFAKPVFLADAPKNASLEGYLFPDTYRVYQDAKSEDIIKKMLNNFGEKVNSEMLATINKQQKNLYEVITMASILEKEVKGYEDMRVVAGIFWNRLKNRQALQSCATLAYILGVNKKQYSYEDTKIDSPYNTYQNQGLPPGPIANPGLNAIRAAIDPIFTDYNFFLSRLDNGQTVFSKNLEEHNINKARYLK